MRSIKIAATLATFGILSFRRVRSQHSRGWIGA